MPVKLKVVLLGDSGVGKTSMIRRFVFDLFEDTYVATIGGKVTRKNMQLERPNGTVDLSFLIWDLIGREGYVGFHARTFAGTRGAILVADLTRNATLESLEQYWIPLLHKVVGPVPLVVVGNKSDLRGEHAFGPEEIAAVAARHNPDAGRVLPSLLETSYLTSAKMGTNVERAFESLGHLALTHRTRDPVKEMFENVVAMGLRHASDPTTAVGALDAIVVDFCEGFDDPKVAMLLLRQEIARAGVDISDPDEEGILRAVDFLAEAESEFKDRPVVLENRERRRRWVHTIRHRAG